jgi:2-aminoadipate transaminase
MPKYGQYDVPSSDITVNFGTGQPNNLNLPINWFQNVCLKMSSDSFGIDQNEHGQLLQYGAIPGYNDIRYKMSEWLSEKYYSNLSVQLPNNTHKILSNEIFMTNGNTGALQLILNKYCETSNVILVENPTYFIAINIFNEYGLNVHGVNMESDGINLYDLENKLMEINSDDEKQEYVFLYLIPTHHNPTSITISHEKRIELAKLCDKYENFYIIADEVYHFLTFEDQGKYYPMADYHSKIISLGSFSKILAPALRVGWIYQNTRLLNYNNINGFINGPNSLMNSCVLDSSGGINPIGFKFIEYALNDKSINQIIETNNKFLRVNCDMMTSYLSQFENITYQKPEGGYFYWIKLNTISDTTPFLKFCEKNKVKFHPGIKFSSNSTFKNYIRLSFSYYSPSDLIIGLDRLMECVKKYNSLNVKIMGASGKLGSLIKQELLSINDINYLGDIKREFNKSDVDINNLIIIDVSSAEGTHNLLNLLIKENINVSLIIGTTGLLNETFKLIETYSLNNRVAHITNFSEGVPLIRQFAKLSNTLTSDWKFKITDIHHKHKKDAPSGTAKTIKNEIIRDLHIESIRTGEIIGDHILELSNGFESIKILHSVVNRNTFAKGCINYIYWILTQPNGYYTKMDNRLHIINKKYFNDNILICVLNNDIPLSVKKYMVKYLNSQYENLTKISLIYINNNICNCSFYQIINSNIYNIKYCGYTAMEITKLLIKYYKITDGYLEIDNNKYRFKDDKENYMLKLPIVNTIESNSKDNDINILIQQISNITLLGISRYRYENNNYLVCEVKNNIFKIDMLQTIATIINTELSNKFNIIFINSNHWNSDKGTLSIRFFNQNNNEETSDNIFGCICGLEYYMYNFIKNYDKSKQINVRLINDKIISLIHNISDIWSYDSY